MIIALFADIHSNLDALQACLKHAGELGAQHYAFLGDLVGYGADPGAVVETIAGHASRGAVVVKGNHDDAITKPSRDMTDLANESIEWTFQQLSGSQKQFLASLPLTVRTESACFVHASADVPERWTYVDSPTLARHSMEAARTPYVFSGHVHDQMLYFKTMAGKTAAFRPTPGSPVPVRSHHNWLVIAGSVGQPRDGNPAAAYACFDDAKKEITFFRVPYDYRAAANKIRKSGLPDWLAHRIENGV